MTTSKTRNRGNGFLLLAISGIMISTPVRADTPVALNSVDLAEVAPAEAASSIPVVAAPAMPATLAPAPAPKTDYEHVGDGEASYYGNELAGNRTASGERFNPRLLTAAHRTLPLGSKIRVTNKANGKSVVVRVNDRGPFAKRRVLDLSLGAAREIQMVSAGKAMVRLELLR